MAGPLDPHGVFVGADTHLVLGGDAGLGLLTGGEPEELGGDGCFGLLPHMGLAGATGTAWNAVTRGG